MPAGTYVLNGFNISLVPSSSEKKFWTYLTNVVKSNYKFTIANMTAGDRYKATIQSFNSLHTSAWSQHTYAYTSMAIQCVFENYIINYYGRLNWFVVIYVFVFPIN